MESKRIKTEQSTESILAEFQIDEWKIDSSSSCPFDTYNEWVTEQYDKIDKLQTRLLEQDGPVGDDVLFALDAKFIRLVKENVYKNVPVGQVVKFPDAKQGVFLGVSALGGTNVTFPEDEQTNPSIPEIDDQPWPTLVFKYTDDETAEPFAWREEEELKRVEMLIN